MRYIKTPTGYVDSYRFAGFRIDADTQKAEVKGYYLPDDDGITIATFDNFADAQTYLAGLIDQLEEDLSCK